MENKKIQSIKEKGCFNCAHHMNGLACNCKTKCFSRDQWKQTKESKEFELKYCEKCIQMTNHIDGICQKCKPVKSAEEFCKEKINPRLTKDYDLSLTGEKLYKLLEEYASQSEPINQKLLEALKRFVKFTDSQKLDYESSMIRQAKQAIQQAEQLKQ
jgi:hypothetical protein